MFRIADDELRLELEARPGLVLVGKEGAVRLVTRFFAGVASYARPTKVVIGDRVVPVTDHLMLVRLGMAAATMSAMLWRWLHD